MKHPADGVSSLSEFVVPPAESETALEIKVEKLHPAAGVSSLGSPVSGVSGVRGAEVSGAYSVPASVSDEPAESGRGDKTSVSTVRPLLTGVGEAAFAVPPPPDEDEEPSFNHPAEGGQALDKPIGVGTTSIGFSVGDRASNGMVFSRFVRSKTARIIGDDNGWGLSRDLSIVRQAFEAAGWTVFVASRSEVSAHRVVSVNVHLEKPATGFFDSARQNVIVPNPEWWSPEWNMLLKHSSVVVWAKTKDTCRVFQALGARVVPVGFRSVDHLDRQDVGALRERSFLHVAGNSPNKGTARLFSQWKEEWPRLTIVGSPKVLSANVAIPSWVMRYSAISEEDLRELQNKHLFHIYLSSYEGFGHAQWEGLSCGAIVVVPAAPPFDDEEWSVGFDQIPVSGIASQLSNGLDIHTSGVGKRDLTSAVMRLVELPDEEIADRRVRSRSTWERAVISFEAKVSEEIAALDDTEKDVFAVSGSGGLLGTFPPMSYVGRVNCVTGYGQAARHQIWALRSHGLRLRVVEDGSTADPDPGLEDAFIQEVRRSSPGVEDQDLRGTIFHVAPNMLRPEHFAMLRPHILVSVWETTKLPVAWVPIINRFDQVWCATEWQKSVYLASGVSKQLLHVVPFTVDASLYAPECRVGRKIPEVADLVGRTIFGSVFQWTERKNPRALLEAYFRAFAAPELSGAVALVLKSYEGDDHKPVFERVQEITRSFGEQATLPPVIVLSRPFSSSGMLDFYQSIDCYVSAHRGEAFGFPIAEALCSGRSTIATSWSAPAEYAAGLFRGVGFKLVPPHGMDWQPYYTADQLWADVYVEELAQAMRAEHIRCAAGQTGCSIDLVRRRFWELNQRVGIAAREALEELGLRP